MSNHCSNLCNCRSFSFCTSFLTPLKPYVTNLRPYFPFQRSLILINRRFRSRSPFLHLTLTAQSSSDIVLIATTEHHDGSLVFRFGDASEVVENDEAEELESQTEGESSGVKVVDGDQERQVIIKTGDRGYDGGEGRLIEVADGIRNVDIDIDIAESETIAITNLRDYQAESRERLPDVTEKENLLSQSDAKMSYSVIVVESTLDEAKFNVHLDEDESSDSKINFLDNSPNIEKSAYREGTLMKISDDKTVNPSVTVELESSQVSQIEAMDDLDMVEIEDTRKGDVIIDEATLIDELSPSNPLDSQLMYSVNEDVEEELKGMNINEATILDELPSTDQLVAEPALDEVGQLQSVHVKDQTVEDESLQLSIKNREENDLAYVTTVSHIEKVETAVEEEVIHPQSISPLEFKPTIQVLNTDLQDTMGQNLNDGILEVDNEIKDPSVSVKLETIQVSNNEVMNVKQPCTEDESQMVESKDTNEGVIIDLSNHATMHASDGDMDESLQDMNICEAAFIDEIPTSESFEAEPTLEVSTTKGIDVKDVHMDERLQDMNISEGTFNDEMPTSDPFGVEPNFEVSTTKGMDVKDVNMDERLQDMNISEGTYIHEMPTSDPIGVEPSFEDSTTNGISVKNVGMDERLQVENISKGTFIDNIPASDPLGVDATFEVSNTKGMDVKDVNMDTRLQNVNISVGTSIDEMPTSDSLGAETTLEVSAAKGMDVKDVDIDKRLQDMNISVGTPIDEMPTSDSLGAETTLEVSTAKVMNVKDVDIDERLQDMNISEAIFIDEMPTSDVLGAEQTLEVSTTEGMDVKDLAVEDELQLLKQGAHDPLLEAGCTEGMVGRRELAEATEVTALFLATEAEVESREEIFVTGDFLLSGAALLEHPFKALTGGHDACFVAGSKWLGVANGVNKWSFEGTDPGIYAQELMRTCEEIVLDTSSVPVSNPVELLCRGVKETNMSGSANVLIANFNGQALHVANIGDTRFLVIRHGSIYMKSSPLLHEFHFALQVEDSDDPLQLEHMIELEMGDIVVSATDGLFDNLYEREIAMIVSKSFQAGMKPQEIAKILATRAQEVGKSAFVRSPFSDAAQAAGYTGYAGGKPDNVAVIVSLVEKRSELPAA
ncbi:hypothetical protein E3N88_06313 [Mikania micrantha]|uniref:PPM-type phosphatase domain-containing protein n=1 Tax=Mikania micrantha TaxID=192012 RepID=A0A5N6PQH8_9ASTR|nr:hypothetical protein E3N88_06313 [Mikania micrantha]